MFWRYLKVQAYVLLCGAIGPLFLFLYFASDRNPFMTWFFWSGLAVTVLDVLIAVAITVTREKSAARRAALEQTGVLALAQVVGIEETGTHINDQPLVKLNLQISAPGLEPFVSQDKVIASMERFSMITNRKLVALVDPATREYQIDWDRSSLISGLMPATFTLDGDDRTYDLSGQTESLMEILRILMSHGIGMSNLMDLQSNLAARQQVRAAVRRAATEQPAIVRAEATAAQRLQELDTLRVAGGITEAEYTVKRQEIIASL